MRPSSPPQPNQGRAELSPPHSLDLNPHTLWSQVVPLGPGEKAPKENRSTGRTAMETAFDYSLSIERRKLKISQRFR